MGSILHLHTTPEVGGDTMFASMYAAYEALSGSLRSYLETLTAIHGSEHVHLGQYGGKENFRDGNYPENEHPIVRTHPVTRRIVGLKRRESDALLTFLFDHVCTPEFHVRFKWEDNSVAFWDNRCVQHHTLWDYYPQVRSGYRVTAQGNRPFFNPNAEPVMNYTTTQARGGGYGLSNP